MVDFVERFEYIAEKFKDNIALDDNIQRIAYGELNERASKIYAYLKEQNIQKEEVVLLFLPRGVDFVAGFIGVMKAGAAFVPLEDSYPKERVDYIAKDTSVKLILDIDLVNTIYKDTEPLEGHEKTDPHDLAYIVYTSGTTGNPKGILHEYGNVSQCISTGLTESNRIVGLVAPFYFVGGIMGIFMYVTRGDMTYIVSHDMLRDFPTLKKYIYDTQMELIYLPPSYIRIYTDPSPYLKVVATGSEPANGLCYPNRTPHILNTYGMSECGFRLIMGELDRKYDVAPVGKPATDVPLFLVDEEGNVVDGEGTGEICFKNEYVRGYLNLPEKTSEVFVEGIYHTGDIANRDAEGRYYIVGRADDMIKINGNRVEPAEIEAKVQEITGLEKVVAKGFALETRSFVCVYYIKSEAEKLGIINEGELVIDKERLKALLPDYMIPAYYVPLDEFPLTASGKISKKLLACPDVEDYQRDYEAPINEKEAYFCEVFSKVLKMPRIGRKDDFFQIGGDSIRAIQFTAECTRYEVKTKDLYENPTPEQLALACREYSEDESAEKEKRLAEGYREENISGRPFMEALQKKVLSTSAVTLKHDVDIEKLRKAWENVLVKYPFYNQHLEIENGKLYYVRSKVDTKVRPNDEILPLENYPRVSAEGKRILFRMPHAFTDGFGMKLFTGYVVREYLELMAGIEKKLEAPIYIEGQYYDMLAEDLTEYGKNMPKVYAGLGEVFHISDPKGEEAELYQNEMTLEAEDVANLKAKLISEKYKNSAAGIGGTLSVIVANLVAEAIRRTNPDNSLPIGCRCPVNLRNVLKHEDSLKNMSLCQAVIQMDTGDIASSITSSLEKADQALEEAALRWQLAKIKEFLTGVEMKPEEKSLLLGRMFSSTFLLTNVASDATQASPDEIVGIESENRTDIPLAVIIGNEGNKISIRFLQQFESDGYFENFKKCIEELL